MLEFPGLCDTGSLHSNIFSQARMCISLNPLFSVVHGSLAQIGRQLILAESAQQHFTV